MRGGGWPGTRCAARLATALAGAGVVIIISAATVLADCGDTAAAVINGPWQYVATVSYVNTPTQHFGRPPGVYPAQAMSFASTCAGPSSCALLMGSSGDPHTALAGSNQNLYADGFTTLAQSGSNYSGVYPSGGVGGPNLPPCRPPSLASFMTLHVVAALKDSTGTWQPAYIAGSEVTTAWWTCNGTVGVPDGQEHVDFVAVPAGKSFPASVGAICTPVSTAVAPASGNTTATPLNPEQSTISTALATPAGSFGTLGHAVGNALITLGIVLFITFPATLFNKTFEENYDDIRDIMQRRFGWLARLSNRAAAGSSRARELGVFALVVLAGAAIGGLNDPHFGFNSASLKTYVAVILAVLFGVGVGTLVGYVYRRLRRLDVTARLTALPAGLVVAGLCVLVSRVTQFEPGYLYGVICGVAFAATLQRNENGHLVAISSAVTLGLGVVAWFVWVPVKAAAAMPGASALTVVAGNFLAAVFVGGLVGSVLGLVPLRFLPGGALAQWNRAVWGAFFGLAVFGLLQVMLRPESSSVHTGTTAVVTAGVLFVLFGGISLAFRLYFERRRHRARAIAAA